MAIAGKVAITPKGEWNANTAYTKLDLVFYENASYVAIQPSTGVTPTNTAYWMLVVQSAGGADLEAIIDGSTQVGNAKTLDGHGASEFVQNIVASGINNTDDPNTTEKSRIRTKHANCPTADVEYIIDTIFTDGTADIYERRQTAYGTTGNNVVYNRVKQYNGSWSEWEEVVTADDVKAVKIKGTINTLFTPTEEGTWFVTNNADGTFPYVYGLLEVRYGSYTGEFVATFKSTGVDNCLYYNTFTNGSWGVWKNFATMADLANYLPKNGGTLNNELVILLNGNTSHPKTRVLTDALGSTFLVNSTPDNTKLRAIAIHTQSPNVNTKNALEYQYTDDGVNWGIYPLLHTGNKPTGTYTGNGDATERIIATGGIGNVAVVTSIHGTAFVAHSGGIMMNASAVVPFGSETSSMFQGNMAINTDDARLNASGVTYTYQVL